MLTELYRICPAVLLVLDTVPSSSAASRFSNWLCVMGLMVMVMKLAFPTGVNENVVETAALSPVLDKTSRDT